MTCAPWPVVLPCDAPPEGVTPEQEEAALSAAQTMLWSRTGRRLGTCTVTERYRPAGGGGCGFPYFGDDLLWHNGGHGGMCCAINLDSLPVQSIQEVVVDQVIVPAIGYWFESPGLLMRRGSCWPIGAECDPPRVIVTYTWGVPLVKPIPPDPPDAEGSQGSGLWGLASAAMGEVTLEIMNAMCGRVCRLPSRMVNITRQGVTVTLADPASTIEARLLGLPLADALILSTNPGRKMTRSRVYSPDMARRA